MTQQIFDAMLTDPDAWREYHDWRGNPLRTLFENVPRQSSEKSHLPTVEDLIEKNTKAYYERHTH